MAERKNHQLHMSKLIAQCDEAQDLQKKEILNGKQVEEKCRASVASLRYRRRLASQASWRVFLPVPH
jgi:hypothetical protein